MFYNRQAQASAAQFTAAVAVGAIEPFGQAGQVNGVNARPLVAYRDFDRWTTQNRIMQAIQHPDLDRAIRTAIFDGILHQVGEDLQQLIGIPHDAQRQRLRIIAKNDAILPRQRLKIALRCSQDIPQVKVCRRAHVLICLDPAQGQQLPHQTVHALGFTRHNAEKPVSRPGVVSGRVAQGFNEPHDRRERSAQFMADIGDKVAAHLLSLGDLCGILKAEQQQTGIGNRLQMHIIEGVAAVFHNLVRYTPRLLIEQTVLDRINQLGVAQSGGEMPSRKVCAQQHFGRTVDEFDLFRAPDEQRWQGKCCNQISNRKGLV
ncbi:hypothetical protein PZ897_11505 [Hoeflea sp. YIM 152468]|uniref:hypothetical protein n=1 Tax=Hoeflea sp. YIM 152468 TaxID=3031759 RepID=UPI0023DB3A1B|nr:hypothetical protein [Hoeflea sp. YIM 152468]MDF1608804.1 hypothetical protein [Hoeflea sp. YIM 152468]